MRPEREAEVREAYEKRFLPAMNQEWFASYLSAVHDIRQAAEATFRSPEFQKRLWELEGVASVGMGSTVTVPGAYADAEVVDALWSLREWKAPEDRLERARALDAEFERILALVSPRHNPRRPSARLVRIFATVRHGDVLCLLDWQRTGLFREWLEQPRQKLNLIGQHVICRAALRDVLGLGATPENDVLQSQFSWYAWDNILRPEETEPAAPAPEADKAAPATATPRLAILPAKAQRKGINYLSNNLDLLLAMVLAAENGIDRPSLDQRIAEEAPGLSRGSRANLLAQAPALGLLSFEGGIYRPTRHGHALLDGDPPAEVLAPAMARTVFGFAQILDDLGHGAMTRVGIAQACRGYYPRWTTDFAPNQLVAWMKDLGLVEVDGAGAQAQVSLTEAGEYWRSGLPADMKRASFLLEGEQPDEKAPAAEAALAAASPLVGALAPPSPEAVLARFREDAHLRTLVFGEDQVRLVHAALHAAAGKRFVLLAGLSGTGKTSMARGYAQAYCQALGLDPAAHYEQVAVLPDWTDPTGLLGFVNPLADPPAFQETEALRLVLAATAHPDRPYFLCLDEMNLARVEHYFAPFLSAMEGRSGRLAIHAGRDPVDNIPPAHGLAAEPLHHRHRQHGRDHAPILRQGARQSLHVRVLGRRPQRLAGGGPGARRACRRPRGGLPGPLGDVGRAAAGAAALRVPDVRRGPRLRRRVVGRRCQQGG